MAKPRHTERCWWLQSIPQEMQQDNEYPAERAALGTQLSRQAPFGTHPRTSRLTAGCCSRGLGCQQNTSTRQACGSGYTSASPGDPLRKATRIHQQLPCSGSDHKRWFPPAQVPLQLVKMTYQGTHRCTMATGPPHRGRQTLQHALNPSGQSRRQASTAGQQCPGYPHKQGHGAAAAQAAAGLPMSSSRPTDPHGAAAACRCPAVVHRTHTGLPLPAVVLGPGSLQACLGNMYG